MVTFFYGHILRLPTFSENNHGFGDCMIYCENAILHYQKNNHENRKQENGDGNK